MIWKRDYRDDMVLEVRGVDNMTRMEIATEYEKKANEAYQKKDHILASELNLKAAGLYKLRGNISWAKYLKGRGWYLRTLTMKPKSIEEYKKSAECFDKAIKATNIAIDLMDSNHPHYNMALEALRLYETRRFTDLSIIEIIRAEEDSENAEETANHFRRAALFRRSVAFATELAAEVSRESGSEFMYNYQIGGHHLEKAHYHHFLARSHEALKNLKETLQESERSKEECEKAVKFYKKSLNQKPSERRKADLENAKNFLVKRLNDVGDLRSMIKHQKEKGVSEIEIGAPKLDVKVIPVRGMVRNLITTISVRLTNSGTAEARNIRIELDSEGMEGDVMARMEGLAPGRNARVGLSIIPMSSGKVPLRFIVKYKDSDRRRFKLVERTSVRVSPPKEKRPERKVIVELRGENAIIIQMDQ